MNKEDEVIEILDDFEDNTITIPPINKNVGENVTPEQPAVVENIPDTSAEPTFNNLGVSTSEELKPKLEVYDEVKNLEEVKYDPIEPEKQEIKIETETKEENTKSGLGFVIVLFILLAIFVILLPYISKLF